MKNELIKYAPLFAGLSDNDREILAAGFIAGECAANAFLLKANERSDAIYLVGQGFVSLSTQSGQALATLGPGSLLGEAGLFRNAPQDVSAVALSNVEFWKLTDRRLRELILQQPSIGIRLSQNFGSLIAQMQDYLAQRLSRTPELGTLPMHTLQAVASRLVARELREGETLYRAGDAALGLILVENGELELRTESDATGERTTQVQPGTLLGALPLLANKPYQQTAVAVRDSLLWVLPVDEFHALSGQQPGLRRSLGRNARARLGRADQAQAMLRMAQMPIFAEAPPQAMQAIVQRMVLQHVPAGERVYMMGEAGDALYLIDSGEVELTTENAGGVVEELARVGSGGYFGEMSLLTGQIRTEDATAIRNTNLWVLAKRDLDELANQFPAIGKALSQGIATRLSEREEDYTEDRFRRFELLAQLGPAELKQVVESLRPMRYRGGEQIYRATSPADTLFLLEKGQVRIQPLSGGSWLLGPGEAFGERALLTNQPHNASAMAETDVDVWTLSKQDFDALMNRYPSLAISMSRILSQRLAQMSSGGPASASSLSTAAPYTEPLSTAPYEAANTATMTSTNIPSRRRRPSAVTEEPATPRARDGFAEWYNSLTPFGKLRLALLLLLLFYLIFIAAPSSLMKLLEGTSVASGAALASQNTNLLRAIHAVYAVGSYELAAQDKELAQALAMADRLVPPTPVFTPPPTPTPVPTQTPLPTPTFTPTAVPPTATAQVIAQAPSQFVPPTATAEPVVQAAALTPPRAWDPRLDQLGVVVEEAQVSSGQQYWKLIEARWQDEIEAAGKHHIYVEVLDENGNRVVGQPVTVYWSDGGHTGPTENKQPPDYAFNYQMYAAGNAYHVKVEGLPSDILHGAGMGDLARPRHGIHTNFLLTFQKVTKP